MIEQVVGLAVVANSSFITSAFMNIFTNAMGMNSHGNEQFYKIFMVKMHS